MGTTNTKRAKTASKPGTKLKQPKLKAKPKRALDESKPKALVRAKVKAKPKPELKTKPKPKTVKKLATHERRTRGGSELPVNLATWGASISGILLLAALFLMKPATRGERHFSTPATMSQGHADRGLSADPTAPPVLPKKTGDALEDGFQQSKGLDMGSRIAYWSAKLYSRALPAERIARIDGSPVIQDTSPLVPAKFDCTTFVETVAALAKSQEQSQFFQNLVSIRYRDSRTTFVGRNHFPEADWIPNNERSGALKDITGMVAQAAGFAVAFESKTIDRASWLRARIPAGQKDREIASTTEVKLPYIPLALVPQAAVHIPNGAIVNVVRRSSESQPVLISHQGFLIRENGEWVIRHATDGRIRNMKLQDYLQKHSARNSQDWPVIGINLNALN